MKLQIEIPITVTGDSENAKDIIHALQALIGISKPEEGLEIIRNNPGLLDGSADSLFKEIIVNIEKTGDEKAIKVIRSRWEFLQKVRQIIRMERDSERLTALFQKKTDEARNFESLYLRGDGIQPLNLAIQTWEEIFSHSEFDSYDATISRRFVDSAANAYIRRYWATGDVTDLNRAISLWEQTVSITPEHSRDLPIYLNNLGNGLNSRYSLSGNMADIEEGIKCYRKAVFLTPENSSDFPIYLNNLGIGLKTRYSCSGNFPDLEEGIKAYRKSVILTSENSPELPVRLSNLGEGLRERYSRSGDLKDLEEGIELFRKAVLITPENSPDLAIYLNSLGNGLSTRYSRLGIIENLEEGIEMYRKAILWTPDDSPDSAIYLNNLATGLNDRFAHLGNPDDLDEGIESYQRALSLTPKKSPDYARRLNNLGEGLTTRYYYFGSMADLEQGIEAYRQAVFLTPENSPDLPRNLNNLGTGLADLYSRSGKIKDIEDGICAYEKAISLTPENSPDLPNILTNLGCSLRYRFLHSGKIEDLMEAIRICRKAVSLTPENSTDLAIYLNNLGNVLISRYSIQVDPSDLEEAVNAYRKTVSMTPERSPELPGRLNSLGNGLSDRYSLLGKQADLENGIKAYRKAAEMGQNTAVPEGLKSARNWLLWAFDRQSWHEVEQASFFANSISKKILKNQLLHVEKEIWLSETQGIAQNVAYALVKMNKFQEAAMAIEQGQARLLSEALSIDRANLEKLRETEHAGYIDEYQHAADQIRHLTRQVRLSEKNYEELKAAQAKLDSTIEAIRQIKEYEKFLTSPYYDDIKTALKDFTIVYIMATGVGGLALIVSENMAGRAWLSELTDTILRDKLTGYLNAYSDRNENRDHWHDTIEETTHWLWQTVMRPIIEILPSGKKVTLIPTGLLNLLPLHAAWTEDETTCTGRRYALDCLTISYSPNARILSEAGILANRVAADNLLAIDDPMPVEAGELPNSEYEVQVVSSLFEHRIFRHGKATRKAVLKAMPEYNVLHFSCHGKASFENPMDSSLFMSNNARITLKDLFDLRLKGARLAVLSACETGIPGTKLPDEVVHLPSGFLYAGVAGVISSLWTVSDLSTMMVIIRFYDYWRKKKMKPPDALRQAQIWLRDSTNREKTDYFGELKKDGRFSQDALKKIYHAIGFSDPQGCDFAHPYYWAGFTYTGV